jgi:hypothetical protein
MGKFLIDAPMEPPVEPYTDGTPTPTVVTKEVDMTVTAHFVNWLSLTFQKQRWSRHTLAPLFLWITGNRQSKARKGLSWSE